MSKETCWPKELTARMEQYSPCLAAWITAYLKTCAPALPVYDLGCGKAEYVAHLQQRDFQAIGFEGTRDIASVAVTASVIEQDITERIENNFPRGSVLCLEVMEHILADDHGAVLDNIDQLCDDVLILSWAIEGQPGHGHVACRNASFVIPFMLDRGYHYQARDSVDARAAGGHDRSWYHDTVYVFRRNQ